MLNFADCISFFGDDTHQNLIMIKSPISGLCLIEILTPKSLKSKHDAESNNFQVVQTFSFNQEKTKMLTNFEIYERFVFTPGPEDSIFQIDLLTKEVNYIRG